MALPTSVRVNRPHIIHEIIEGEAILVNLETGSYYSTAQSGAAIWDGVELGMSVAQIVDDVTGAYAGDPQAQAEAVRGFVQQLLDEGLVSADQTGAVTAAHIESLPEDKPPFQAPVLKKYTEMQDLLLIDPIHDVDETGWPQRPEPSG